jgi:pentatricopeptide repeat protein
VLRGGAGDPRDALAWAEQATLARPDVPGLVHTLGVALLAAGRLDEAIRAFDSMWSSGELQAGLEAERCLDLARAWEQKGHPDYADDYRARAARTRGDAAQAATRAVLGFDDDPA